MKTAAIALNTAREALRNRVLYSILFFAAFVVGLAALFGSASIGDPMKYVKDFSLMCISLFGVAIAVIVGVSMLHNELGRRTILNILSKPVARWQFVVGKFLGLLATLAIVVTLMCTGLVALLAAVEGQVDWGLVVASGTTLLELMVVVATALFFSSVVVTPTLAGLFTAGTVVAGRSSPYLAYFSTDAHSPVVRTAARALYWALPHLDRLNVVNQVVYGDQIPAAYLLAAAAYATSYAGVLLLLAVLFFSRREFV